MKHEAIALDFFYPYLNERVRDLVVDGLRGWVGAVSAVEGEVLGRGIGIRGHDHGTLGDLPIHKHTGLEEKRRSVFQIGGGKHEKKDWENKVIAAQKSRPLIRPLPRPSICKSYKILQVEKSRFPLTFSKKLCSQFSYTLQEMNFFQLIAYKISPLSKPQKHI